ncbi:hypothetical protein EYF80_031291 [Liparis tanakae]|uniref:Uncharacterized protein n=1 Tax=Liparis tanakae TaxID=230148 RepID=A0A4Z2GY04_9TELE|nr:hypothetical protein EYF80_031291 [Liparis tanakae]
MLRPWTDPVCLWHSAVTEPGETLTQKADLPRMVLPEELLPDPVLPSRTILRGSASDAASGASQTVARRHIIVHSFNEHRAAESIGAAAVRRSREALQPRCDDVTTQYKLEL